MRIVTWNCNGALRKKIQPLLALKADVYVVQECENPEHSKETAYKDFAKNSLWIGENKNKGIGIFSTTLRLKQLDWDSKGLQSFLPFTINDDITAMAVWTRQANSPTFGYIGQAWKYLQEHKTRLPQQKTIICGDFNSNARWDVWDRWWNHSDVVRELAQIGLESVYHHCTEELQGKESQPTFFMYRRTSKPYHIDHAFLSRDLLGRASISVGQASDWLEFSDHMPVTLEIQVL